MLHSLFKTVVLKLNGEIITNAPEFYYYKAYLENLMTFDKPAKHSWLQSCGYSEDSFGGTWHTATGTGYQYRALHFREKLLESSDWTTEGDLVLGDWTTEGKF